MSLAEPERCRGIEPVDQSRAVADGVAVSATVRSSTSSCTAVASPSTTRSRPSSWLHPVARRDVRAPVRAYRRQPVQRGVPQTCVCPRPGRRCRAVAAERAQFGQWFTVSHVVSGGHAATSNSLCCGAGLPMNPTWGGSSWFTTGCARSVGAVSRLSTPVRSSVRCTIGRGPVTRIWQST